MDPVIIGAILVAAVLVVVLVLWLRRGQDIVVVPPVPPAQPGGDVPTEVQALLAQGQKIEAIKRVRELTGLGLKEAKDYVEGVERGVVPTGTSPQSPPMDGDPRTVEEEARQLLATGNAIAAIKRVRELTGLGLKEAKDYVDALQRGSALPVLPATAASDAPTASAPQLDQEARGLLARGRKIEAIKRVREVTGWGLKEAKDYVERL
jgi:ribosomal protein L7/L12